MYLVVSMTAATALLLWMEHLVAPPGTAEAVPPRLEPLLTALKTEEPIQSGTWNDIVISYREGFTGKPSVPLASSEQFLPYHFVIGPGGSVDGMPAWKTQKDGYGRLPTGTRSIHVCFAGQPDSNAVSPEQWNSLLGLLRQLRHRCDLPQDAIRLDPQSDPRLRPDISRQAYQLRQMLLAANVID
jgi:hypothetical protein